jgi:hypothetical protein
VMGKRVVSKLILRYVASRQLSPVDRRLIERLTEDIDGILEGDDYEVTSDAEIIRIAGCGRKSGYGALLLVGVILRLPVPKSRRIKMVLKTVGRNLQECFVTDKDAQDFEPHVHVDKGWACVWWGNSAFPDANIKIAIDRGKLESE